MRRGLVRCIGLLLLLTACTGEVPKSCQHLKAGPIFYKPSEDVFELVYVGNKPHLKLDRFDSDPLPVDCDALAPVDHAPAPADEKSVRLRTAQERILERSL